MSDLVELFTKYGTDKLVNGYAPLYHALFHDRRERTRALLEIGIGTMIPGVHSSMVGFGKEGYLPGASLRAWRDYFPNAGILGMDVQRDTQFTEERIQTMLCDSRSLPQVNEMLGVLKFDIIIDDGSHIGSDQLGTLEVMYSRVNRGGIYIIEDIGQGSVVSSAPKHIEDIVGHNAFFFAGVKSNLCAISAEPLTNFKRYNY